MSSASAIRFFALKKSPRFVVMNVYGGNDFLDALNFHRYVDANSKPKDAETSVPTSLPRRVFYALRQGPLASNSYIYNFALTSVASSYRRVAESATPEEMEVNLDIVFPSGETVSFNKGYALLRDARLLREGAVEIDLMTQPLKNFSALSHERDFVPIVVFTPAIQTVYAEWINFEDPEQRALGFHFLDLTPTLVQTARDELDGTLLYSPRDSHFTEFGHQVAAEQIAAVVMRLRGETEPETNSKLSWSPIETDSSSTTDAQREMGRTFDAVSTSLVLR